MSDHEPQQHANDRRPQTETRAVSQTMGGGATAGNPSVYDTPLWDATLPIERRVDWLLSAMTIEEKLGFLATSTPDLPRLGITRCYIGSEAAHGIEARHDQGAHPTAPEVTTSLPQPIGMASTWDTKLLKEAGAAVGTEARVLWHRHPEGGLFRWAPTVDLERDPRWGRNEEGYGEDPVLTGEMAGAYVRGMQGGGPEETRDYLRISAALKHFFDNNVEDGRCITNSVVDARNRHEYYYEPFRRCIEQAGATSVMTAYNAVNGTVQMHDPRVEELLHGEYGLNGHVVSDGGAVSLVHDARHDTDSHAETVARSIKAGVDCMTDDMNMVHTAVCNAWERGLIDETDVDRALRRSFTTKIRLGLYDRPAHDGSAPVNPFDAVSEADIDSPEHRAIALRVAEESVVLLKNDGLLPFAVGREPDDAGRVEEKIAPLTAPGRNDGEATFDREDEVDVAVIGPLADQWFQDWYGGEPPFRSTVLDGVRRTLPAGTVIAADDALDVVLLRFDGRYAALGDDGVLYATDDREKAEQFRFQDWGDGSLTFRAESNGLYLTAEDDGTIHAGKRIPFGWFVKEVFRLTADGRLTTWSDVPLQADDNGRIHAVKETDLSAQRIGVPQTVAIGGQETEDSAASLRSVDNGQRAAGSNDVTVNTETPENGGIKPFSMDIVERGLERAAAFAGRSRVVIAAVGCCSVINGKEDADRPSTAFPPAQRALMQTLLQANPRTAMVLVSNYPYDIDWEQKHAPAIVWSASGGQSMGEAIARVLFGAATPAGRLPQTWYGERVALPDKNDYDIIATKRTYQWHDGDVLYPFGHGLTYAPFEYSDLHVTTIVDGDGGETAALHASVCITNVGNTPSDEVVQLYVRHPSERMASAMPMPNRRLVAFRRMRDVQPGECRTVEFDIPREELRIFDVRKGGFRVPDGTYAIEAGASSADIRTTVSVQVKGERPVARPRGRWIPVDHWDESANADLIAAEPLPGQRRSEACALVPHEAPQARRARGEITPDELVEILAKASARTDAADCAAPAHADDAVSATGVVGPIGLAGKKTDALPSQSVASARFAGFEPFAPGAKLRLSGIGINGIRVQTAESIIDPAEDDSFPLPAGADELTLIVPVGSAVSGLLVE
ncbi:glycoside hydrolase family 3 C-terminal domain-containing protein [Bifidobacterium simiiventris]|uniref:glycoside hydrolase family 3 C-terminal domain-containing protein n=1 Tax=Bifidobacterium simiiventris TaxID=2834434 RepID=UPI001C586C5C|nr:glycoside hydrolase family 3 C-terminal domain-containing protein [Bifidobacterium simiiventris]MBW3079115.1 glycoside hydrolase family 3 C-terminal domain-containing protein [Bifidobacterium simiiventris]